ncbi:MAG: fructosamine kinase family protein [Nitrospinae bacterium CG11_big_fil_rev_8_21_14_0_20_56_8]|nr:MAG: fructosamine kinase family protein [Nitrospinae bacterium CG11_big_fil_rev_8_21_14_0_20_56_8]
MNETLPGVLRSLFGESITIRRGQSVGGGCINETQTLHLSNGEKVFLKYNGHPPPSFFSTEMAGLNLLRRAEGGPRIPRPLALEPGASPHFLILEFIEEAAPGKGYYSGFALALAALHRVTQDRYGLDQDNFIGKTVQINAPEHDPIVFFRDRRLRVQQALSRKAGLLPAPLDAKLDRLCDKLGSLLDTSGEKPALVHGDLWSGNHFASPDNRACIFDPAAHFGLRETDLAMSQLFGSLPAEFYRAYHEAFPLNPGYEGRRPLYNLYHLLNHLNLFGRGYLASVEGVVRQFV